MAILHQSAEIVVEHQVPRYRGARSTDKIKYLIKCRLVYGFTFRNFSFNTVEG